MENSLHLVYNSVLEKVPQKQSNTTFQVILNLFEQNTRLFDYLQKELSFTHNLIQNISSQIDSCDIENNKKIVEEISNLKQKITNDTLLFNDLIILLNNNINEITNIFNNLQINDDTNSSELDNSTSVDENLNDLPKDNNLLIISEKDDKVYFPYFVEEINEYLRQYPHLYNDFDDVIEKEFVTPLHHYQKNLSLARFREAYSLMRDKESKSIIKSTKFAFAMAKKGNLNPVIIAACKTEKQLANYLACLEDNKLDDFKDFEIKYEVPPIKIEN